MPELVDVEGFRRVLTDHGAGRRIADVEVRDPGVLRGTTAPKLRRALRGRRFREPRRHGKWLIAYTDGPALAMHFGMTGSLVADEPEHRHDRIVFQLGGHVLTYRDMRKLTGVQLAENESDVDALLSHLGPDALTVDRSAFCSLVRRRRRKLKPALMDQSVLAGLGNLLVDEILWRAKLSPQVSTAQLDDQELSRLHGSLRSVLRTAAPLGRVPPRRSWLTGHRDRGEPCPRCHTALRDDRFGGRRTVWCPKCQPGP